MKSTFVIGSIGNEGNEITMHTKHDVLEISYLNPVNFTGSFTTGFEQPKGEVMKLAIPNISGKAAVQQNAEPIIGKHLREAVAIVKDWHRNP